MSSRMARMTTMVVMALAIGIFFLPFFSIWDGDIHYTATGIDLILGVNLGPACTLQSALWRLIYMLVPIAIFFICYSPLADKRQFQFIRWLSLANSLCLLILRWRFMQNVKTANQNISLGLESGYLFFLAIMFMGLLLSFFGANALTHEAQGEIRRVSLRREPWLAVDPNESPEEWKPIYIRDPQKPQEAILVIHPWDLKQQEKEAARRKEKEAKKKQQKKNSTQ